MWKLLALGYGLLYEHVDMIGGVTQTERATKTANFLETRSCSLSRMLISVNQNAERAGKRERTNFDRSFFTEEDVVFAQEQVCSPCDCRSESRCCGGFYRSLL